MTKKQARKKEDRPNYRTDEGPSPEELEERRKRLAKAMQLPEDTPWTVIKETLDEWMDRR